jgi:Asp-tRNA(Asn)/Glu-tRNA(Gln) amidotransferase A subunit family amidase
MARSVADAALFQNVVSGPVEDDMFSLESLRLPDVLPDGAGMRVALCRDLGYFQLDDEVGRAMDVVADRLREASITVDEVELDWSEEVVATAVTHLCFQARSLLQVALDERGHWEGRLTSYIEEFLNLPEVTASQWQASWSYARHMFAELQRKVFGAGFDALLCPTSTTTAVPADLGHPDAPTPDEPALDAVLTKFMTYPFNVLGRLPVLAMPAGMTAANDVPIGVQIVGPVNADLIPFRIASTLERATGNIYQAMRPQI